MRNSKMKANKSFLIGSILLVLFSILVGGTEAIKYAVGSCLLIVGSFYILDGMAEMWY